MCWCKIFNTNAANLSGSLAYISVFLKFFSMCVFHSFAKVVIRKIRVIHDFDQIFIYYLLK